MKIFAVKDKKAEGFNTPFFQPTFGLAERAFQDACKDEKTTLSKHPEDYSLHHIGDWDPTTGTLEAKDQPELVCDAPRS